MKSCGPFVSRAPRLQCLDRNVAIERDFELVAGGSEFERLPLGGDGLGHLSVFVVTAREGVEIHGVLAAGCVHDLLRELDGANRIAHAGVFRSGQQPRRIVGGVEESLSGSFFEPLERARCAGVDAALLRREIQEAGGLEEWLRTRLGRWLKHTKPTPRCPVILPWRCRS